MYGTEKGTSARLWEQCFGRGTTLVSAEEARSCAGGQNTRKRQRNELAQRRCALKSYVVVRPQRMHLSLLWREHSTGPPQKSKEKARHTYNLLMLLLI